MKQSTRMSVVFGVLLAAAAVAWYLQSATERPRVVDSSSAGAPVLAAGQGGNRDAVIATDDADDGPVIESGPSRGAAAATAAARQSTARHDGVPVPVRLALIEPRTVPVALRLMGRAEAWSTVSLRARIDGQILAVEYQPGQAVTRGQVMVRLDDRLPRSQEAQARANLARDQANLGKAVSDLKRAEDLRSKGFVSSAQVDAARAAMQSLRATVDADQAAIDMARTQLDYTRITAPIDGVAGSTLAFPGSIVRANDTPLVVINQIDPIHVQFSVPEARLAEIRHASGAPDGLPVRARIPGDVQDALSGRLSFIDNAVDPTTGTIALKAEFANPTRRLTPGQFVEVDLMLRQLRDALVIPAEALQNGPAGSFVYIARTDGTVEMRPVRIGAGGEGATLVVSEGLVAGERVVIDGQLRLTPGARFSEASLGGPRRSAASSGGAVSGGGIRSGGMLNGGTVNGGTLNGGTLNGGIVNGDARRFADPS